jgi:hypothetical protein
LYKLPLEVQERLENSALSNRGIFRRTASATQFYRFLDQTNYRKSVDQLCRCFGFWIALLSWKTEPQPSALRPGFRTAFKRPLKRPNKIRRPLTGGKPPA